jgi:5-methylcytosine-specific restriction endonuclease McrA
MAKKSSSPSSKTVRYPTAGFYQRSWSQRVRFTPEWAAWRQDVFRRDGFRCVIPSCQAKKNLEPHHIIRKIERPDLIHDIDNGVTLCHDCHEKVTGQEALFVVRFKSYVTRLHAKIAALSDMTGLI